MINPFGEDDDDYDMNWLIDRHTAVSKIFANLSQIQKTGKNVFFSLFIFLDMLNFLNRLIQLHFQTITLSFTGEVIKK